MITVPVGAFTIDSLLVFPLYGIGLPILEPELCGLLAVLDVLLELAGVAVCETVLAVFDAVAVELAAGVALAVFAAAVGVEFVCVDGFGADDALEVVGADGVLDVEPAGFIVESVGVLEPVTSTAFGTMLKLFSVFPFLFALHVALPIFV